jgi:O-acetyl-ADP-ribose deacetylase (regulator of RNase III)
MDNQQAITVNQARLSITQGDITLMTTDAIVNAANSSLMVRGACPPARP